MKAQLYDISEGINGLIISFKVERGAEVARLRSMPDTVYDLSWKKYTEKRSLNANSYMWTLLDKLAAKLNADREELYLRYVRHYGIWCDVTLLANKAKTIMTGWERQGLGWKTEVMAATDKAVDVRLYYGTSVYNKEQMTRVIDAVVEDCKDMGIETRTPEEIAAMIAAWKGYEQTHKGNEHTVQS